MQLEMLKPELSLNQYQIDNTIVVYGSARVHSAETVEKILAQAQANNDTATLQQAAQLRQGARYYEDARQFARLVAQHSSGQPRNQHYYICTGGGPGIMEAANKGAYEAGGVSVGLHIQLPHEQGCNKYVKTRCNFRYFFIRKFMFVKYAMAYVVMPGGMGTIDELSEAFVLAQTGRTRPFPIILYDSSYWSGLLEWLRKTMASRGFIKEGEIDKLITVCDTPEEVVNYLCRVIVA